MEQKRGGETKNLKGGSKLGQGVGALKRMGLEPIQTMLMDTSAVNTSPKFWASGANFWRPYFLTSSFV